MAPLRKTLPKDLDALLAGGDFAAITAALAKCLPDAQDALGRTALAYAGCTEALTEWLLARGASLAARDRSGNTLLQSRVASRGDVEALLRRGVAVDEAGGNGGTALHTAATTNKVAMVERLLAAGALPNATDRRRLTPLEAALEQAHNAMLPSLLAIARALLAAGATRTPRMDAAVVRIGERFEFMRPSFNVELLPTASEALTGLRPLRRPPDRRATPPRRERADRPCRDRMEEAIR
jgi:ankyrin repeat protein